MNSFFKKSILLNCIFLIPFKAYTQVPNLESLEAKYDYVGTEISENRRIVAKAKKWGYVDRDGNEKIELKYDRVNPFKNGFGVVTVNGKQHFVDVDGKDLLIADYEIFTTSPEKNFKVRKNNKVGLVDITGKEIIPVIYENCDQFNREGVAAVKLDKKFGFVDKNAKIVIPIEYDELNHFEDGLIMVKKGAKYGFINKTGQAIVPIVYDKCENFREGLAMVTLDKKIGFVDKRGNVVIPVQYDKAQGGNNGLIPIQFKEKWGMLDLTGKIKIPFEYDYLTSLSEGLICAKKGGKIGYLDSDGKEILPFIYGTGSRSFNHGVAIVEMNSRYGLINKKGEFVLQLKYAMIGIFNEGLADVSFPFVKGNFSEDRRGYIDTTGKEICNLSSSYESCGWFKNGFAIVKAYDKFGFMDKNGFKITPLVFDKLTDFKGDLAEGTIAGETFLINKEGKYIFDKTKIFKESQQSIDNKQKEYLAIECKKCRKEYIDKLGAALLAINEPFNKGNFTQSNHGYQRDAFKEFSKITNQSTDCTDVAEMRLKVKAIIKSDMQFFHDFFTIGTRGIKLDKANADEIYQKNIDMNKKLLPLIKEMERMKWDR
jgi:WG containing repeat